MIPGGRQSGGNVDYIFEWDGQSSTDNTDNLILFQNIYNKQKEKDCIVIGRLSYSYNGPIVFIIRKNSIALNTSTTFKTNSGEVSTAAQGNYGYTYGYVYVYTVSITLDNTGNVTSISKVNSASSGIRYLDTTTDYGTIYTPTYNGSPTTKKYVDDAVANCKLSNLFFCTKDSISYANNTTMWNDLYTQQKIEDCYLISTTGDNNITILYTIPQNYLTNTTSTSQVKTITSSPYGLNTFTSGNSTTKDGLYKCTIDITIISDSITTVGNQINSLQYGGNYLSTATQYSTPYTPLYSGSPATKKYADDLIIIGDEEDASPNTQIIFDEDELDYVTEVVDSLEGNETDKSPSVSAVNQKLATLISGMETYTVLYNDSTKIRYSWNNYFKW